MRAPDASPPPTSGSPFERVAAVLARAAGLVRSGERGEYLRRRIENFIHNAGQAALDDLLARAEGGDAQAVETLRNAMAVNYTYFWREPEHFGILLEQAMTSLRKKVGAGGTAVPSLHFWSAGCASGEEAWSMAIVAAEAQRLTGIPAEVEILATDIDTAALVDAKAGLYREEVLQQLPQELRDRYLESVPAGSGRRWQVRASLRPSLRFAPLDLLAASWPPAAGGAPFDVIFCRNVLIYFSDSARLHVFEMFATLLAPDGLLVLSRVEGGIDRAAPYFRPCGDSVYLPGPAARRAALHRTTP